MAYNNGLVVGAQVGIREELADYIAVVDAKSTPLISMAGKGKDIGNMLFSWQVDNYASPQAGGTADGADFTVSSTNANASTNRTRLYNYAEVFRRGHRTGFIADTQNVAAVADETSRAVAKRLVELKRDMEAVFACANQPATAEDNTPTASRTGSLGKWMNTTVSAGTAGAPTSTYAPASGAVDTTATASLVESSIQAVLTAMYTNTGTVRSYDAIVGTTLKRAFTKLTNAVLPAGIDTNAIAATAVRTFNQEIGDRSFVSTIDVFEGDFGTIRLHPSTFINTIATATFTAAAFKGYVLPMEMIEVRYSKLPEVTDLPNAGGGPIKLVQAIAGLVVKNPAGMGMFNATA